jgi:hypothetical protein
MNTNKISYLIAGGVLILSMLACNFGTSPDPYVPLPPQDNATNESAPVTEIPTDNTSNSSGACTNPYLPVIAGATWNYKLTGPTPDTFTRSILSVEADGFTDQDIFSAGVSRQGKWKCDNGSLVALNPSNGGSASINAENVSVDFQTTELSGVTLPATVNAGDAWTQTTTLEGTETINDMQIPAKNQFTNTCTAIGVESVTVEAGTFDALRVECQTVMNISVTVKDNPILTSLTFTSTNFYAENIGLVKTVTTGEGLDSTVELVSYNIP